MGQANGYSRAAQRSGGALRLYVNIDHVATVREARKTDEPDPVLAARAAEAGGADGITFHLREDRRHIQDRDVEALAAAGFKVLNFELATSPDIVALAVRLRPHQATLVPERREEVTTEGGLALARDDRRLADAIARLTDAGIRVSLFIDPDRASLDRSAALRVPAVELHTGRFAHAWGDEAGTRAALEALKDAATYARSLGLAVHAGHGLTYRNVHPVAAIDTIEELNIGHSIVSRAMLVGMQEAVAEMGRILSLTVDPAAPNP
jgi:pyridoxine 5-phosphate synthase